LAALITELTAQRIHLPAFRAGMLQFPTTSVTKYGLFRILIPALWALHIPALQHLKVVLFVRIKSDGHFFPVNQKNFLSLL
jgi:hypothetical protein